MSCGDHTNNNTPVGVGYDSKGRAKSLMELNSIVVQSISAAEYEGIPAVGGVTELSGLSDVCDGAGSPSANQALVYNGSQWCPSTLPDLGGGGGSDPFFSGLEEVTKDPPYQVNEIPYFSALNEIGTAQVSSVVQGPGGFTIDPGVSYGTQTQVNSIETSTINLSAYVSSNEVMWTASANTLSSLTGDVTIASPVEGEVLMWVGNRWEPSTSPAGVTDHSLLTNLDLDDAHPQYVLSATNNELSSLVNSIEASTINLSAYVSANEGSWADGGGSTNANLAKVSGTLTTSYTVATTTSITLEWGDVITNTTVGSIGPDSTYFIVSSNGVYEIDIGLTVSGNNRVEHSINTFIDTGSGFVESAIDTSHNYSVRNATQNTGTTNLHTAFDLTAGDSIQFQAGIISSGAVALTPVGTILTIKYLGSNGE